MSFFTDDFLYTFISLVRNLEALPHFYFIKRAKLGTLESLELERRTVIITKNSNNYYYYSHMVEK